MQTSRRESIFYGERIFYFFHRPSLNSLESVDEKWNHRKMSDVEFVIRNLNKTSSAEGNEKVLPIHAMMAYRVSRIQLHLFSTSTVDDGERKFSCPGRFNPREITPVHIGQEVGWVSEPECTFWWREKYFAPTCNRMYCALRKLTLVNEEAVAHWGLLRPPKIIFLCMLLNIQVKVLLLTSVLYIAFNLRTADAGGRAV